MLKLPDKYLLPVRNCTVYLA